MRETARQRYDLNPEKLRKILPRGPGIYQFLDTRNRVVYVGKAKDLSRRVMSYFRNTRQPGSKTAQLMGAAKSLEFILTLTEKEAFILENELIKKHQPRYNIILRDDKQYPCLKLNIRDPYPRLSIVRHMKKDGALYFGPFSSAGAVRHTARMISRTFKLRKCKGDKLKPRERPCINYQMNRCLGPCAHDVPESVYWKMVEQVRFSLEGRNTELLEILGKEMLKASEGLDFERAAEMRDRIAAVKRTVERQHVVSRQMADQDVIGIAENDASRQVAILFVRRGHLSGSRGFLFEDSLAEAAEVMESFLKQYYGDRTFIPPTILISSGFDEMASVSEWLSELAGRRVKIHWPQRGGKRKLTEMAVANAQNLLSGFQVSRKDSVLASAQKILGLKRMPETIEGLDISNFQGEMAVGTVAAFKDGEPYPRKHLNFRIKNVNGVDDYGMMSEMITRRLKREPFPHLFLVDGGKGHLAAVLRAMEASGEPLSTLPEVISIAKPNVRLGETYDKLYIPGRKNPVRLNGDHPVLMLMTRVRDEVHRRAVTYHRKLRSRGLTRSLLDDIHGIGKKRKRELLRYFNGIYELSNASAEELCRVPGINEDLAKRIMKGLSPPGPKKEGGQAEVDEKAQNIV